MACPVWAMAEVSELEKDRVEKPVDGSPPAYQLGPAAA